jgi:tryptophan 7-halogenase
LKLSDILFQKKIQINKGKKMQKQEPICNEVVIVGGGTAGFMTAAALCYKLKDFGVKITLVESSQIATIGVGEATVPAIKRFFQMLDLDISKLLQASNGTFKLGIEFENWAKPNHKFFHPFGRFGVGAGDIGFQHIHKLLHNLGQKQALGEYNLGTQIAYKNRFGMPRQNPKNDFEIFDWAIHFDASLFAKFLKDFAIENGLVHIDAKINEVKLEPQSGNIESIKLDDGRIIGGKLFIDCSGMRAILLQGALETGYNDWRNFLPCDRAIAIGCEHKDKTDITPYTRARAQEAGWTWRIPLQNRIGNGYVYCSQFIDDDKALAKLESELDSKALSSPNYVKYITGHAKKIWNKNCVAIGLSAGFLEPLESTSISLIQVGIDKLLQFWPNESINPKIADEYNRISTHEYERIRDFIILHYKLNARHNEPFWDYCRNMEIPETLQNKIDCYQARGHFVQYSWESFFDPSWHCMYEGFGILPQNVDPFCTLLPDADLQNVGTQIRADIEKFTDDYPSHFEFIQKNCAAK